MDKKMFKNPSWILFLGACPALVASTGVRMALGMSAAVAFLMLLSAIVLSVLKKCIPVSVKIPVSILVVAFMAALVQMLMGAFIPKAAQTIGLYIAVLAVDMLVFATAADNGANSSVGTAIGYSIKCAVYFTAVVVITAVIREVFGAGEFFGMEIPFLSEYNVPLLTKAPGAFFTLGIAAAIAKKAAPPELASESFASEAAGN